MDFKIPPYIIKNFIYNNFPEVKVSSTNEYHFNSPFYNDKKLRLYIEPNTGKWFDQKLQKGGNFSSFVSEFLGVPAREAAMLLIKEYSGNIQAENEDLNIREVIEVKKELELPQGLTFFMERNSGPIYNKALKYLQNRKIDLSDLGYIYNLDSPYHNRIFIPFYEEGRLVYFQCRTFVNNLPRYKNPTGIESGPVVYNIDKIENEVFIFEGAFDALSLKNQIGTCLLTSSMRKEQAIKILNKGVKEIIFVPDNDPKLSTRSIILRNLDKNVKLIRKYAPSSLNVKVKVFWLPEGIKDFNEYVLKTGKDYIDKNECELYNSKDLIFKEMKGIFNERK